MLTSEAIALCRQLRSPSTRLSDIIDEEDPAVVEFIRQGIVAANAEAASDSARIVKWALLETDFSVAGGELGERTRLGTESWPQRPGRLPRGAGSLAAASVTSPSSDEPPAQAQPPSVWYRRSRGTWGPAYCTPFPGSSQGPQTHGHHLPLCVLEQTWPPTPHPVGEGRPQCADSVTGMTTKLKRAVVAKMYQAEIESFYKDDNY